VPDGPDDGTIAPWSVVASLPFAPEIVLLALRHFDDLKLRVANPYGYKATFNRTFPRKSDHASYWVSPWHYGLNQGPIVLMIENFRSGLLWRLMRQCPYLVSGLRRAGYTGGWLGSKVSGSPVPDTRPAKAGRRRAGRQSDERHEGRTQAHPSRLRPIHAKNSEYETDGEH
jgi:hypothetical protein